MGGIREEVEIEAPMDRVWEVVHGDIPNLTRWSDDLAHAEVIGGGPVREGARLRYDVKLLAGRTTALTLLVERVEWPRRCAGTLKGDAIGGSWSWSYSEHGEVTRVVYESKLKIGGLLRFGGAVIERDVRGRVRGNLESLKAYVETGGRPERGHAGDGPAPESPDAV